MGIYIHKGLVATKLEMSARRQDHRRRDIAHTPHLSTLIGGCTQLKCLEHYGEVSCPHVSFTFFWDLQMEKSVYRVYLCCIMTVRQTTRCLHVTFALFLTVLFSVLFILLMMNRDYYGGPPIYDNSHKRRPPDMDSRCNCVTRSPGFFSFFFFVYY